MSILDGLVTYNIADTLVMVETKDVREVLTNPPDEKVAALRLVQNRHAIRPATWLVIGDQHAWACDECNVMLTGEEAETHALRMVLVAAAGGDQ